MEYLISKMGIILFFKIGTILNLFIETLKWVLNFNKYQNIDLKKSTVFEEKIRIYLGPLYFLL